MSDPLATAKSEAVESTRASGSGVKGLRWWMLSLTMTGSILNYLTRATLATAAVVVLKELKIDEHQYSYILTAFQIAIMFQPLAGYVLDVLGLRIGLAIFATAWSLINMAHGLASNWQMLAGLRALLGFAEGSANPAGMKATAEWFPAKERGVAGGIYNIGASFGSMLAPPLVAWAILHYNWQASFVITGGMGLVWVALWLLFYQSPKEHPAITESERDYIAAGQETALSSDGTRPSIWNLARQRNFWG
ncbi:MAG TPA: MFS transporter, partial [Pyrinomonadaceae bacterium]|nr:MFS transporter [Pyrinomonadaceae bacterium]